VPKLLSQVQKEECMRISQDFVDAVERSGLSMLDNIITMDETLVSYYTPETKRISKEWTLKGKPGPLMAKVQASHSKQMVFAFFDSRGLIYMHIAPRSATINAPYVVDVLGKFWRSLRLKRPEMLSQQWFFPLGQRACAYGCHGLPLVRRPRASGSSTRRIRRILRRQTFSYLEKSKRGWAARAWTRRPSRTPGRGSPGVSPLSTSPPPSEAG
jgi:hypothetical protein